MELRKELPEIFESFAEGRQNAFLAAKAQKEKGLPLIGLFCTYFPMELAMAMNAAVVALCSTSEETIPIAEETLPKNLCPLIKSSYGFAISDKCPFFYFADFIVGETTCDGKKKMFEYLAEFKPVHIMQLPNSQDANSYQLWKAEVQKMRKVLEARFEVSITDEAIKAAIRIRNQERRAIHRLFELMKQDPAPLTGYELFQVLHGASFCFDRLEATRQIEAVVERVGQEKETKSKEKAHQPRILLTGCPISGVAEKILQAIERNGASVVVFENCTGAKNYDRLVDEANPDVIDALASRYLKVGCSVMSPNPYRFELLDRLIEEYQVDGVVEMTLQSCHTYNAETFAVKRFVTQEKRLPYIHVETDYSKSDLGQLDTRLAGFIEMLY